MATGVHGKTRRKPSDKPMDETHRKILKDVREELVKNMNVDDVLLQMAKSHVFSERDEEEIKSSGLLHERCETFLDILPRRGEKAFSSFIEALSEVNQPWLAKLLSTEAELSNVSQHSAGLETRVRALENRIEELENEIEGQHSNDKVGGPNTYLMEQKLERILGENSKLRKENDKIKEQIAAQKLDKEELVKQKTSLELKIMAKDDETRNMAERVNNLETERHELKEKANQDSTEIQRLQGEVRNWESKCSKLEDQLKERTGTFVNYFEAELRITTGAPEKDKPMDDIYRKILRRVREELVEDMDVRKVLRHMAAAEVFTVEDEDIIKTQGSRQEQCETFLDMLPTRDSKAYGSFIKALKEVQSFLAEVVIEAENKELNDELTSQRLNSADLKKELRSLERLLEAERKEKKEIRDRCKALTEKLPREDGVITTNKDNNGQERRQHELTDLNNNEKRSPLIVTDVQGSGGEKFCPQCNDLNEKIIKSLTVEMELQKKINQLKEENKKLKEEKRRLTSKIKDIEKQISMDELKDVKAECDRLKKEKELLSTEMAKLREKVDKLRSKNEKLVEEMTTSKTFVNCVLLPQGTDFQSTGIIGALKRNVSAKLVATRSSDGPGEATDVLCHRNDKTCGTEEKKGSWWRIDLGENYLLIITHCALKNGRNDAVLRKWQLQGSTDGRNWTELRTEKKQFEYPSFTATWSVEGKVEAFRYFQILQTGLNSSGKYGIFLSGVELYGVLLEVRHGMSTQSKSSNH